MEKVLMKAIGYTGVLELLQDKVRIRRLTGGVLTRIMFGGIPREKSIFLKDISIINFNTAKKSWAGGGTGFIQFVVKGAPTPGSMRLRDIEADENAVTFGPNAAHDFEVIKEAIERKIATLQSGGGVKVSELDELEKLAKLRDKGIITSEEFNAKKKQILGL